MVLHTFVPVDPAINYIRNRLEQDINLHDRTSNSVSHIILLEFCLKNTYFLFQGRFCEQVQGAAMGSLLSPILAKVYIKAIKSTKQEDV